MNPKDIDLRIRNKLVNENIYHSGYGEFRTCPVMNSVRFQYRKNYDPGTINELCKVLVYQAHPLDIAHTLCDHGMDALISGQLPVPAIMYPMGREFVGTNLEMREGVYNENIILRTNYPYVIKKQPELFEKINEDYHVIYSNPITVIRDQKYDPIKHEDIYKVGVITTPYSLMNKLLDDKLSSADLLSFQIILETVFQTAICGYHEVLIIPLFDNEFKIPVNDQIMIYNLCILKYGHKFKGIMVCVSPYEDSELFNYVEQNIVNFNLLTKEIDIKYDGLMMAQRLEEDSNKDKLDISTKMTTMDNDGRMEILREMIKNKKDKKKIKSLSKDRV